MKYFVAVTMWVMFGMTSGAWLGCKSSQSGDTYSTSETKQEVEVSPVAFCDLVRNPAMYNGKSVRVTAIAIAGLETAFLYDAKCHTDKDLIRFTYENEGASQKMKQVLGQFVRGETRKAEVTVDGYFEGTSIEGYGHLNSFRFQILITDVVKGKKIDPPTYP